MAGERVDVFDSIRALSKLMPIKTRNSFGVKTKGLNSRREEIHKAPTEGREGKPSPAVGALPSISPESKLTSHFGVALS